MLRRSSLVECVSVLHGTGVYKASNFFLNLLNLFWHTDKNFCFYAEVNFWDFVRNDNSNKGTTARLNENRFGRKKKVTLIQCIKKCRDYLGRDILGTTFFLRPNLFSFNRAVVPLFELSFLTKSQSPQVQKRYDYVTKRTRKSIKAQFLFSNRGYNRYLRVYPYPEFDGTFLINIHHI
jgi:hypothetical protein